MIGSGEPSTRAGAFRLPSALGRALNSLFRPLWRKRSIKNLPEPQSVGWRRHARGAAVLGREHLFQIGPSKFAPPQLGEGPHNSPAHFVEETIPFDDKRQQRSAPLDFAAPQGAHGRFHLVIASRRE